MKTNKMAAVRAVLKSNPGATASEIVTALGKQKIKISVGVATNYKSVIKGGKKRKKKRAKAAPALATVQAVPSANGSNHGLDPKVVAFLKAGKQLGWKKVRSIVELIDS